MVTEIETANKNKVYLASFKGVDLSDFLDHSDLDDSPVLNDKEIADKTKAIVAKLKGIPAIEFKVNLDLYKELYVTNTYTTRSILKKHLLIRIKSMRR